MPHGCRRATAGPKCQQAKPPPGRSPHRQGFLRPGADTNLASIGYHFGSREALLSQALEELFDEWTEVLAGAAFSERETPPLERLTTAWKASQATLGEHHALIRAFIEALAHAERSPAFREQMRDHYRRSQRTVARLVEAAMGPDAVAKGADPMVIALFLMAVFDGLAVQFRIAPEDTPSGEQLVGALTAALAVATASTTP